MTTKVRQSTVQQDNIQIDWLSDVDTSTVAPTDGQLLVYNLATLKWKPGTNVTYIGTTSISLGRTSAQQTLTGISIDGSAGSVANALTIGTGLSGTSYTGSSAVTIAVTNPVPSQTGNSGKYLTTDGTTISWATVSGGGGGTVTSVAALTIATTGTDVTSTVATGTSTPVITLNIPTASASNRGVLSTTDWTTFNTKLSSTDVTYVGTTSISLNRASLAQTLTGVNIDGSAGSVVNVLTIGTGLSGSSYNGSSAVTIAITNPVPSIAGNSGKYLTTDGTTISWATVSGGGGTGTVTSVAALTIATTGTDITSTVATGTSTPVITLNIPTASVSNRGVLSSADWTTFNNKLSSTDVTYIGTTSISLNRASLAQTLTGVSIDGSAATLTTARLINGVSFNGSSDITITASAAITIKDRGTNLTTSLSSINFTGQGVTSSTVGNDVTVTLGNRVTAIADGTSVTINCDTTDTASQINTQAIGTLTINAITGTPVNGQKLIFKISSTNVQTFSWNAIFSGSTDSALPTVSSGSSKYDYMGFIYNSDVTKWQLVAKNFGF